MGIKVWSFGEIVASADLNNNFVKLVPVGTILAFNDFNGAVTFDTDVFAYCNGQTIEDSSSLLNGVTLPDLSNRYLVGFGTDGGADIGSATWSASAVGNAGHLVNLAHSHVVDSHVHGAGSLKFKTLETSYNSFFGWSFSAYLLNGTPVRIGYTGGFSLGGNAAYAIGISSELQFYTKDATGTTDSASPSSDSQLSTTQSIQPRSIKVRFICRYK